MAGLGLPLYAQTPPSRPNLGLTLSLISHTTSGQLISTGTAGPIWLREPRPMIATALRPDRSRDSDRPRRRDVPCRRVRSGARPFRSVSATSTPTASSTSSSARGTRSLCCRGERGATFAAPRPVGPTTTLVDEIRVWAHVADFDGDGRRDILVPELYDTLKLYRGNGDLTFQPAVDLFTQGGGYQPADADERRFQRRWAPRHRGREPAGDRRLHQYRRRVVQPERDPGGRILGHHDPGSEQRRPARSGGVVRIHATSTIPTRRQARVHVLIGNGNGTFQPLCPS